MSNLISRMVANLLQLPGADAGLQKLSALLDVPVEELAASPTCPRLSYHSFTIRKRDGRKRHISAPSGSLKSLQRRLLKRYLALQPVRGAATAFRPGYSIAAHARQHLGQALVLSVDLADFFPCTSARRVRRWFAEQGWQEGALQTWMRLCVYRGGLPQGAPTSPVLSNLVNWRLDEELSELAGMHAARYTRYADDLAFSWAGGHEPLAFRRQVEGALEYYGYQVQSSKGWRSQLMADRPEITGLVLDGRRLRLSAGILERMRTLSRRRFSLDSLGLARLQGYRGLKKMLNRR